MPFVVTTPTVPRYTQTTVDSFCIDRYKLRYNDNSSSGNSRSCNKGGNVSTTTKRSVSLFNTRYTGSTVPKVTAGPFKYKNTVSVTSLATTTKGYQKGLRNVGRGKRILNQCIIAICLSLSFPLFLSLDSRRVSLILHGFSCTIGDYLNALVPLRVSSVHFPDLWWDLVTRNLSRGAERSRLLFHVRCNNCCWLCDDTRQIHLKTGFRHLCNISAHLFVSLLSY